jgi:putative peptidoglycan lipid II flippase
VASGIAAEKLGVAQSLYYGLLATLVLTGLGTTWGAILNAENRFVMVAVVPGATSIVTVVAVIVMARYWGAYALVLGTVGGALIEAGLVGWGLARAGISLVPRWGGVSPAVRQVLGQYAPMIAASFLMGGTGVVTQSMAATLDSGSVSALAYGNKITNLILGIGAVAVSTAILPHFSRMVTEQDWRGLRHTLGLYTRLLLIVSIPVTLVLMYYSESAVALLFQRGAFTAEDTHVVGQIQVMYLLQIPLYIVGMLFVRLLSALKANQVMLWGNAINLTVCVVLSYVLMERLGVMGIALATSLMCVISFCFLAIVSLRLMKQKTG